MNKAAPVLGMVLAGIAVVTALSSRSQFASLKAEHQRDRDAMVKLTAKVDAMDRKVHSSNARPTEGDYDAPASSSESRSNADTQSKRTAPSRSEPAPDSAAEFADLRKKVLEGVASEAERERFWKLIREKPGLLDDFIKQLEKAAADSPGDKEAHRRLSEAYLAKLMSVPDGMQKGMWSNKMIGVERKILEIDPEDWDARYSIAINYSFWPEQFNKRPDAIKEFDTLRRLQESRPPEPKFAQTYLQLRQLYLKEGRVDDAKAILEEGLQRFPEDAELIKARDGAK